jgi:hypothetical protein
VEVLKETKETKETKRSKRGEKEDAKLEFEKCITESSTTCVCKKDGCLGAHSDIVPASLIWKEYHILLLEAVLDAVDWCGRS